MESLYNTDLILFVEIWTLKPSAERERERGFYFISDTMYNNSLITFALNTNLLLLFSMAI